MTKEVFGYLAATSRFGVVIVVGVRHLCLTKTFKGGDHPVMNVFGQLAIHDYLYRLRVPQ